MDVAYSKVGRTTVLYVSFCFPHAIAFNAFMICVHVLLCWLCVCCIYVWGQV